MKIICVSGKAQHGKDTTAKFLKDKLVAEGSRVLIIHYADLLKFICKQYFKWDGNKDEYGRTLLQYVGTDIVRNRYPDFWVKFVSDFAHIFCGTWDYMIIPDCRFPNEIFSLRAMEHAVAHIRVVRDGFKSPLTAEQQNHISETALDNIDSDIIIHNRGTLQDLDELINKKLDEIKHLLSDTFSYVYEEITETEAEPS